MTTLDEACRDFADAFGPDYARLFPDDPVSDLEQRAWKEGSITRVGLVAVELTYRTEEQQVRRRNAASLIQKIQAHGNPAAVVNQYIGDDTRRPHYVFDRETGLVLVNSYPLPEDEVRPLGPEDVEVLSSSADSVGLCGNKFMARVLTTQGVDRLTADLLEITAVVD